MLVFELPYELTPYGYHHSNGDQDNSYYKEYERETLYDLSDINYDEVDTVFYWYSAGSYCGSGEFLMRLKSGKWILHDGDHCSCNGPLDDINYDATFDSLIDVISRCSQDYLKAVEPLVDMAMEKGYK